MKWIRDSIIQGGSIYRNTFLSTQIAQNLTQLFSHTGAYPNPGPHTYFLKFKFSFAQMKCPHPIEPHQIQGLDFIHMYPVVQVTYDIYIQTLSHLVHLPKILNLHHHKTITCVFSGWWKRLWRLVVKGKQPTGLIHSGAKKISQAHSEFTSFIYSHLVSDNHRKWYAISAVLWPYVSIHREFSKEHGSALLENKQLNALMVQLEVTSAFEWKTDLFCTSVQVIKSYSISFLTVGCSGGEPTKKEAAAC